MKRIFLALLLICLAVTAFATGVVLNSYNLNAMLTLTRCEYNVNIDNQIAVVTAKETFVNNNSGTFSAKYYFPVADGASPSQLRWYTEGNWWLATFTPTPQDSNAVGPGEVPTYIRDYLGFFPVMFNLDTVMQPQDSLIVEITYVQLLSYAYGSVDLFLKNNYTAIQSAALLTQSMHINLHSDRTITGLYLLSHQNPQITNTGNDATMIYDHANGIANTDYHVQYSLSNLQLGVWTMSTFMNSVPDTYGHGFFTMIAEPDPAATAINKVFTLIIDTSGSMAGTKIQQAISAASYIVNNLNPGDYFNIIQFNSTVISLWNIHQPYTPANQTTALNYISSLYALGSTNISGVFTNAIPQFQSAPANMADIIIFMTDGVPTIGITNTNELVNHVHNLVNQYEINLFLFNFGIGSSVNQQLLTLLATDNNGSSTFLGNDELEATVTAFFTSISNPVLLNPTISVTPAFIVNELYPNPLSNIYAGHQLIISGRYNTPQTVQFDLDGNAYGQPVNYTYNVALSDSFSTNYQFLSKIWAKQKVEYLLVQYYSYPTNSVQALLIKQQIIDLSLQYGIITPFTSFSGGTGIDEETDDTPSAQIVLQGNFPNPFNPVTTIRFDLKNDLGAVAVIKIYNVKGQVIRILYLRLHGKGQYDLVWDGKDNDGRLMGSGVYFYTISCDRHVAAGKMTLLQ